MQTLEQMRARDHAAANAKGPVGIGGWLILPMIGMFLSPAVTAWSLPESLSVLGSEYVFTTQQEFALRFEVVGNILVGMLAPIGLLVLFVQRKRQFPPLFIAWQVINLILVLMGTWLAFNAFRAYFESPGNAFWNGETARPLVSAVFGAAIWSAYMLNSKRVRNTFVR